MICCRSNYNLGQTVLDGVLSARSLTRRAPHTTHGGDLWFERPPTQFDKPSLWPPIDRLISYAFYPCRSIGGLGFLRHLALCQIEQTLIKSYERQRVTITLTQRQPSLPSGLDTRAVVLIDLDAISDWGFASRFLPAVLPKLMPCPPRMEAWRRSYNSIALPSCPRP